MACSGQIESHVALIQEARNNMRAAENTELARSTRLQLLDAAGTLIREAMRSVGKIPTLRDLHLECTDRFLKV